MGHPTLLNRLIFNTVKGVPSNKLLSKAYLEKIQRPNTEFSVLHAYSKGKEDMTQIIICPLNFYKVV